MAGIVATTMSGGANKAVAGGVVTFIGAEYVEPILEWLIGMASTAMASIGGIPDPAQFGLKGLGLLAIGAAAVYLTPANRPA
jgi:hypothetical protein